MMSLLQIEALEPTSEQDTVNAAAPPAGVSRLDRYQTFQQYSRMSVCELQDIFMANGMSLPQSIKYQLINALLESDHLLSA